MKNVQLHCEDSARLRVGEIICVCVYAILLLMVQKGGGGVRHLAGETVFMFGVDPFTKEHGFRSSCRIKILDCRNDWTRRSLVLSSSLWIMEEAYATVICINTDS